MTGRARRYGEGSGLPQWRVKALLWVLTGCGLILGSKLFYLQVVQNSFLGGKAKDAHSIRRDLTPPRGRITDRNGMTLAANRNADRLYGEPRNIDDPRAAAQALAPIIGKPADELEPKLTGDRGWVSLAQRLTPKQSEAVRALDLEGVGLEPTSARVYPNGSLASHVLGFANFDNVGSYGVEGKYDRYLRGEPGELRAERDSGGNWLAIGQQRITPPEDGADVELTLDAVIQHYIEEELRRVCQEQRAKGGSIVVMAPKTGEILGMASWPDFNPRAFNKPGASSHFANPAISHMYEPGSTFKIITMAAGLAEKAVTPNTRINDRGHVRAYGVTLHNWDSRPHPNESMTEVLMNSSNVGSSYVSNKVGKEAYYRRLQDFGFGAITGVDLQGETGGMLLLPSHKRWSPLNLYTNAYGQGIAVTPLQLVTAQSAVANGGLLMRPYVVRKVVRDGQVIKENKPTVLRRVLEPKVANTLKMMMKKVVEEGENQVARMPGYSIAGKTGTSSVAGPGGYRENATIASFVGYSPVEDPQFLMLIKVDEPQESPWGARVAAPAFKNLASRIYTYLNIAPEKKKHD
jgi:cell division protein FtsI/penicillin-binding protein 2